MRYTSHAADRFLYVRLADQPEVATALEGLERFGLDLRQGAGGFIQEKLSEDAKNQVRDSFLRRMLMQGKVKAVRGLGNQAKPLQPTQENLEVLRATLSKVPGEKPLTETFESLRADDAPGVPNLLAGSLLMEFNSAEDARRAERDLKARPDFFVLEAFRPPQRFLTPGTTLAPAAILRSPLDQINAVGNSAAHPINGTLSKQNKWKWDNPQKRITIGVIDTGVWGEHPRLPQEGEDEETEPLTIAKGFHPPGVMDDTNDTEDMHGHGTHCIGTIWATPTVNDPFPGVLHSPRPAVMSLKALDPYDAGAYYKALEFAVQRQINVLNLSLGGPDPDPEEKRLIQILVNQGCVVVAAMGNATATADGSLPTPTNLPAFKQELARPYFPAALATEIDGVIAVGAVDHTGERAQFSRTGPHLTLMAPGVQIRSTWPKALNPAAMATVDGTSMAAPFVTAAAALLLAGADKTQFPAASLTPKLIRDVLTKAARQRDGSFGRNDEYGFGLLNVGEAIQNFAALARA